VKFIRAGGVHLKFPNLSRSFNAARQSIRFGGYDTVFEIAFEVNTDALAQIDTLGTLQDEAAWLAVFDDNRALIERAANTAYAKQKGRFVQLDASDF